MASLTILAKVVFLTGVWAGTARKETTLAVVHHSNTETGTAAVFRKYHIQVRRYHDIGYHAVILQNGTIEAGRPEHLIGAHAKTGKTYSRNSFSLGVCLVGTDTFPDAQKDALVKLLVRWCKDHKINPLDSRERYGIEGHHKKCPGKGLDLEVIKKRVAEQLAKK